MLDPRTVANAYVRTVLNAVEAQGVSNRDVMSGIPFSEAQLTVANGRVGTAIVHRIWERAIELTGDPHLGLKVAAAAKPSTFRVLGYAIMSCSSLYEALGLMLRYHRLVSESGILSAETYTDGDVCITYTEQEMPIRLLPQRVEAIIGGILCQTRWLADRRVVPLEVAFRHVAQGDLASYTEFFSCSVQFQAAANTIRIAAADLRRRLPQADAELCRMHCAELDRQLASLSRAGVVTSFAKQWLATAKIESVEIGDLARRLGLSVRSLQRQLLEEGNTWRDVVDEARKEALTGFLQQGMSLETAAHKLGYHDASSLSRAARRWLGMTPGEWRSTIK
jgi:AraC-like DNA-binding protein